MSTDMAPRFLTVSQAGQMTYVLDTSNINLTQVQLAAVPASEIILIQDENKQINVCEMVANATSENVGWLGNNMIVLVSQPQEYLMVEQEVVVDSNVAQSWQTEDASKENTCGEEWSSDQAEESSTTTEDAKCWFRDSLITTAALSTLTAYVQSNRVTKTG